MSVPSSKRSVAENFATGFAANDLNDYTHNVVKNPNYFPKTERYLLARDIREIANKIEDDIWYANSLNMEDEGEAQYRLKLQRLSMLNISKLIRMIGRAHRWNYIGFHTYEVWVRKCDSLYKLLYSWNRKDKRKLEGNA